MTYETILEKNFGFSSFRDNQLTIFKEILENKRDEISVLLKK